MALALTYTDIDTVRQDESVLSWTGKDPWQSDQNYWGNLEFGQGFPAVPTPPDSLRAAVRPRRRRQRAERRAGTGHGGYYNLRGCSLDNSSATSVPGVVIRRVPTGRTTMQLHIMKK